jgi:DNA-binding SARP family transcriptional activator
MVVRTMATEVRIALLGTFRVEVDGRPVPNGAWRHRRGADLVKLLALEPAHRLRREQLMDALWPELEPDRAAANLRKAVLFARRALGADDAIDLRNGSIELQPAASLVVDTEEFERAADRALASGDAAEASRAAALYGGTLIPEDRYEPWSERRRTQLADLHLRCARQAGLWERILDEDPADEEAHRSLMRRHLDEGNRHAAIRQFERLRTLLHEELGVSPDPATVALYEQVLAAEGVEPPTPADRARTLLAEALFHWNARNLGPALRAAEEARAISVDAGLEPALGEASGLLGMIGLAEGRWRERFLREFVRTLEETPDMAGSVFDAHLCLAEFALTAGAPQDVAPFASELFAISTQHGSDAGAGIATLMLGEVALLSGRLADARRDLEEASRIYEHAGATSGRALALQRRAETALASGHGRTEAAGLLRQAERLAQRAPLVSHLLARIYATMVQQPREPAKAAEFARWAEGRLSERETCSPCSLGFMASASIAYARVGVVDAARSHLADAERVAGMWQGGPSHAAVWEVRGHLRLAEGDSDQAGALLREAADGFRDWGRPLDEARCRNAARATA